MIRRIQQHAVEAARIRLQQIDLLRHYVIGVEDRVVVGVDDFLRGTDNSKFITAYFSSPTGRTMYSTAPVVSRNRSPGSFVTETTYGVGVVIQRAPYLQNGFYVKTSYPIGLDKISPFKQ